MKAFLGLFLTLILAGCAQGPSFNETGSSEVIRSPEFAVDHAELDLNGDGALDSVKFETVAGGYILHVNDASIRGFGDHLDYGFEWIDIEPMDPYIELTVGDFGPSFDHVTDFYFYDGVNLHLMGQTSGLISEMHFDGEGFFTAPTRGHILDTWFYDEWYSLTEDHLLKRNPQDLYFRDTPVTMLEDYSFLESPESKHEVFVLKKGDLATISACDDVQWCRVTTPDGNVGWFKVSNFNQMGSWTSGEVFSGLSFAD